MPDDAGDLAARPLVLTIGHSNRTLEVFLELLRAHDVTRLVDVRTIPRSRHNPQFNEDALPATLSPAGIAYTGLRGLGGLRKPRADSRNLGWRNPSFRGYADYMETEAFEDGLRALVELVSHDRVAVMCAEATPWRCHRSLIADALLARGIGVAHILSATRAQPHTHPPFARVSEGRVTYPGGDLFEGEFA